jgi:hypothetical protein
MTKKYLSAGQRWGRLHWIRVFGLRCFYFPFWVTVNRIRRGFRAMRDGVNLVTDGEWIRLTEKLDEHPEDWEHPCMCGLCRSYGE